MHYNRISFSVNGRDTITPKIPNANIGQRNGMSPTDIEELNKVYRLVSKCFLDFKRDTYEERFW